jgi:hypothetical protein
MPVKTRLASSVTNADTTAQSPTASAPAAINSSASSGRPPNAAKQSRVIAHASPNQNAIVHNTSRNGGNSTSTSDRPASRSPPRWASTANTTNAANATNDLIQSIGRRARESLGEDANNSSRPAPADPLAREVFIESSRDDHPACSFAGHHAIGMTLRVYESRILGDASAPVSGLAEAGGGRLMQRNAEDCRE